MPWQRLGPPIFSRFSPKPELPAGSWDGGRRGRMGQSPARWRWPEEAGSQWGPGSWEDPRDRLHGDLAQQFAPAGWGGLENSTRILRLAVGFLPALSLSSVPCLTPSWDAPAPESPDSGPPPSVYTWTSPHRHSIKHDDKHTAAMCLGNRRFREVERLRKVTEHGQPARGLPRGTAQPDVAQRWEITPGLRPQLCLLGEHTPQEAPRV